MKKLIISALAILALNSCIDLGDPVYTYTNAAAYINYKDDVTYNDMNTIMSVAYDLTDGKWKTDGNRFYAIFDVLNIDYDIRLKSYINAIVKSPEKEDEPEDAPGDPVTIKDCSLSGIYLNLLMGIYVKKGSETPHDFHLYWSDDTRTISMILVHDGAGESLLNLKEDDMEYTTVCYSFPVNTLADPGETRMMDLTVNALVKQDDGTYTTNTLTYSVHNNGVTF